MTLSKELADYFAVSQMLIGNKRKGLRRIAELEADEARYVEALNALTFGACEGMSTMQAVIASSTARTPFFMGVNGSSAAKRAVLKAAKVTNVSSYGWMSSGSTSGSVIPTKYSVCACTLNKGSSSRHFTKAEVYKAGTSSSPLSSHEGSASGTAHISDYVSAFSPFDDSDISDEKLKDVVFTTAEANVVGATESSGNSWYMYYSSLGF